MNRCKRYDLLDKIHTVSLEQHNSELFWSELNPLFAGQWTLDCDLSECTAFLSKKVDKTSVPGLLSYHACVSLDQSCRSEHQLKSQSTATLVDHVRKALMNVH